MDVLSLCPFPVGVVTWSSPQPSITFVAKATYSIAQDGYAQVAVTQQPLSLDQVSQFGDPDELTYPTDFVPLKLKADVLLTGHARAIAKAQVIPARLTVNELDRRFFALVATPTRSIPLTSAYLRAGPLPTSAKVHVAALRPQSPRRPLPVDNHLFSPLGPPVGPLPANFDFRCLNAAPLDQQLGSLQPNAVITLEGLLKDAPLRRVWLRGDCPRIFLLSQGLNPPWVSPPEVPMRCDTLWIDTDQQLCTLLFRGVIPLPSKPSQFVVVLDQQESSHRFDHFRAQLGQAQWLHAIEASDLYLPTQHTPQSQPNVINIDDEPTYSYTKEDEPSVDVTPRSPSVSSAKDDDESTGMYQRPVPKKQPSVTPVDDDVPNRAQTVPLPEQAKPSSEELTPPRLMLRLGGQSADSALRSKPSEPLPFHKLEDTKQEPVAKPARPDIQFQSEDEFTSVIDAPPRQYTLPFAPDSKASARSQEEVTGNIQIASLRKALPFDANSTPDIEPIQANVAGNIQSPVKPSDDAKLDKEEVTGTIELASLRKALPFDSNEESNSLQIQDELTNAERITSPKTLPFVRAHGEALPPLKPKSSDETTGNIDVVALRAALPFGNENNKYIPPVATPPASHLTTAQRNVAPPLVTAPQPQPQSQPQPQPRAQVTVQDPIQTKPKRLLLPLEVYALVKAELWQKADAFDTVLERHKIRETDLRIHEQQQAATLADEAAQGRMDTALALHNALSAVGSQTVSREVDLEMDDYIALKIDLETTTDKASLLAKKGLTKADWKQLEHDWRKRIMASTKLSAAFRTKLEQARATKPRLASRTRAIYKKKGVDNRE